MMSISELYERDFNLWAEEMAIAIRNRNIENMDWDNLLQEIEDMTASQKRALRSYTKRLIEHIFKLKYWESERDRCSNGWRGEVSNFRSEIQDILKDSPSLNNYLKDNYGDWFEKVISNYQKNRSFSIKDNTLIPLETMMDDDFFG
ncbi:MAG: DUF29 domain-containing protein [Waterburya sp.]